LVQAQGRHSSVQGQISTNRDIQGEILQGVVYM
jgi:hypothetical protein